MKKAAADAFEKIGSDKAIELLIEALKDQDSGVRWYARYALTKVRSEKAADSLTALLNDQDVHVRVRGMTGRRAATG